MHRSLPSHFQKKLLVLAVYASLAPHGAWALDLVQSPPGTQEPYVAPNVILSLDDSGSMKGSRATTLKNAVIDVFSDTSLLPDGKIRLAWQSMNNSNEALTTLDANAARSTASSRSQNLMSVLNETHRQNLISYMERKYVASGSTPTHLMSARADEYMRAPLNKNGPWASKPGQDNPEYLGCRRNYHILLTDGGWNKSPQPLNPRNYDGTAQTLPDGTFYSTTSPQTQLYRDSDGDKEREGFSTIADWAFYSWANPLKTSGLTGSVQPSPEYRKAPATETFTKKGTNTTATLERFWNPRYDPATWPHMVTFTIGFSGDAIPKINFNGQGNKVSNITSPSSMLPYGYDGDFVNYVNGTYRWRAYGGSAGGPPSTSGNKPVADRGHDMWHAALNGRGQFYAVEKGEDLKKAFQQIIGTINTDTKPDMASTATSGANNTRNDVGKFTGGYEPGNAWKGFVKAETVQKEGSSGDRLVPAWGGKTTADHLDSITDLSKRLILTWSDVWDSTKYKGGTAFRWSNDETYLSTAQKAMLGLTPGNGVAVGSNGQNILNYIRGERSLEGSSTSGYTNAKPFRARKSRQGDIVNSVIWYTGQPSSTYALNGYAAFSKTARTPMLYVGGNDGMLHGFSAADGSEKLAYVPRGVIPTLNKLAAPAFDEKHQYFVDGSPITGDVDLGTGTISDNGSASPDWRTMLVGTLGNGGKGYFVLDVTKPGDFKAANAQDLVKLDRTRGATEAAPDCSAMTNTTEKALCNKTVEEDKDIGHITAAPVLDPNNPMRTTQITRMNDNRWAVVMGNGYNSTNRRPVLLIQYLDSNELVRIPATNDQPGTGNAADNGLASPRLVDLNGDGRPDIAYAGDNLGNLWKFDLTSHNPSDWKVAFDSKPLFTAKGPASLGNSSREQIQPITVAPTVRANDRTKTLGTGANAKTVKVGGMMVAFGTGRNITQTDTNNVAVQTLYSVLDNTRYNIVTTPKGPRLQVHPGDGSNCINQASCIPPPQALGTGITAAGLIEQKITEITLANSGTGTGFESFGSISQNTLDWTQKNGWYMDLPAVGERLLKNMEFYDGSNILAIYSQVPAKGSNVDVNVESCESTSVDEERQYRTFINIMDGAPPSIQLMNITQAYSISRHQVAKGSHTLITSKKQNLDISSSAGDADPEKLRLVPEQSLRPSWRQLR